MIFYFICVEERITWEEFNIYGADAAEASSDSQDGNNESPRYYKSLNRNNALAILYCRYILHKILSILPFVSENALKMKTFAHGKELRLTIRLSTYPPLGVTLQKKVLRSGQKGLRVVVQ